jgi:hypothetical protein
MRRGRNIYNSKMGARAVADVAKALWPPLDYDRASFGSPHTQHDAEKYSLCCSQPEQKTGKWQCQTCFNTFDTHENLI